MPIITFKDVWEMYRIKFILEGKGSWEKFWALRDISFLVEKGEVLGVIGENGSGKTTLLKLIAGMLKPDRGQIAVLGSVSGLLELGAGFQTELTGRENIILQLELYGLAAGQAKKKFQQIIDFAEIGKFIDAPVKCYSQGMFVRLAFAIAVNMDPDIFLIDDTLAVGDEYFQKKCIQEIFKIKQKGKTVIMVTHDMAILQKLCARTIFLKQGMLIKDEETAKTISFYSQTVGSPKGISIIEKKQLNLVFNNGKLLLNWDNRLFTHPSGAYTLLNVDHKWYSSTQADWETREEGQGVFTAIGKFYQLGLTQVWRIEVVEEGQINWDIELEMEQDIPLGEMYVNLAVKDEYNQWFADSEKGDFSAIKNTDKNWSPVFTKNGLSARIGVYSRVIETGKIPTLLFEQISLGSSTQAAIFNSDYLSCSRILQYRLNPAFNKFSNQSDRFICFAGKILVNTANVDNYLVQAQEESSLNTPALRLIFDNGCGILDFKGTDIIKHNHISTFICAGGKWYASSLAQWEFKKLGKKKVVYTGTWARLALRQIWEIEITSENSFLWTVEMQVDQELDIEQQYCYLSGCKDYTYWFSKFGTGKFPDSFLETETDMVQRCLLDGEIGLISEKPNLPALTVKFIKGMNSFAKILNSDFYNRERILRVERVEAEENVKFLPGKYPCFKLEVILDKNKRAYPENFNLLQEKKLKFIFSNGRGRIFWDGNELSKKLGLYTSLRVNGRWHDSMSAAQWMVEKNEAGIIEISGKWLYLPISQFWQVSLHEGKMIKLKVGLRADQEIKIDRLQTNLMVSEKYSQWAKENKMYDFPGFDHEIDDEWGVIYSAKNSKQIAIAANGQDKAALPPIKLAADKPDPDCRLNIINSDIYHRGRVLQYLEVNKKFSAACEYLYFNGQFIIGD